MVLSVQVLKAVLPYLLVLSVFFEYFFRATSLKMMTLLWS